MSKDALENLELEEDTIVEDCDCEDKEDCKCDDKDHEEEDLEEGKIEDDAKEDEVSENVNYDKLAEALGLETDDSIKALKESFETVLKHKVNEAQETIEEELKAEAIEAVKILKEEMEGELNEKANAYVTLIVNEWLDENKVQIENQIEFDRNSKIVEGLKELLEANSIELSEEESTIVEEMKTEMEELKESNEILVEENAKYRSLLEDIAKEKEVEKYNLSESQAKSVLNIVSDFPVNKELEKRIADVVNLISETEAKNESTASKKRGRELIENLEEAHVDGEKIVIEENVDDVDPDATFNRFVSNLLVSKNN